MDKILAILVGIILAAGAVLGIAYYYRREQTRQRQEQQVYFRERLIARLRKKGTSALEFDDLVEESGVNLDIARDVATNLYECYCRQALADAMITEKERRQLNALRTSLGISANDAEVIELNAKDERYRKAALDALADGKITAEEAAELESLRSRLGLELQRASEIVGQEVLDGYLSLFRRIISDGRILPAELEELKRYRRALALSRDMANDVVREEVLGLYRQWFYNVIQDGVVTAEEEQGLAWLKHEFGLNSIDTEAYEKRLDEVKTLAAYRTGKLPSRPTEKLMAGGETCHWEGPCTFQWETPTKCKLAQGELVVTSDQVTFTSSIRSFSVPPGRIIDVKLYSNAIVIKCASSRGTGTYFIRRARELEAILVGLVHVHKYRTCSDYSSELTRHIPDAVRRQVWQRDGGRCVRCKAMDYLEFDHVIPHAKGGANTVANVQLLCRRCNSLKSDRI